MSFCGLLLVFGISTWLPTIMRNSGYSLGSALLQTAVLWGGAGVGMVAGGRVADSLGPKPVVAVAFGVGSLCLLALSLRPSLVVLLCSSSSAA
jgi:AAHS family benzoate transporter-like MFS transporter